jgi:hypothetical protein
MKKYDNVPGFKFVGNKFTSQGIPDYLHELKSVYISGQAYDINGTPLPSNYVLPMYVSNAEYDKYNQIMSFRLSQIARGLI